MTPLERAGKALYERDPLTMDVFRRDCTDPDDRGTCHIEPVSWPELGQLDREAYMDDARAVIEAIREPSETMAEAGGRSISAAAQLASSNNWTGDAVRLSALAAHAAMIEALLEEGQ